MLKDKDSSAIVAVRDMARARHFYEKTLGLTVSQGDDHVTTYKTGATTLVIFVSEFAGTNQANAVVWGVDNEIEAIVADLKAKGVTFEQYPGMNYKDGIHTDGAMKTVWFKDPDGNILHINNM